MQLERTVSRFLSNQTVIAVVSTALVLYTAAISPDLPPALRALFDNKAFSFGFICLIAYTASARRPVVAIAAAVAFWLTMQYLSEDRMTEWFQDRLTPRRRATAPLES